jgi:rfaE bifunctional protein kinase chain/domain/rfaE bifunctional protein nucleotidyltransferase chain/domain
VPVIDKVKPIEALPALLAERREGRRVVQCHGVFDLMHIGHIRHFQDARRHGDILVVTVTPDRYVNKGPHRPAFAEGLRAEAIAALDCVDYVAINRWPTAVPAIHLLRPDVYAKGSDYRDQASDHTGGIALERRAVEDCGGTIVFTDEITFSSSTLLNRNMPVFSPEVSDYLTSFRQRFSADDVTAFLKRAADLKVLVVGEAIIDEYQYCETLGKSGKEPILAAQYRWTEQFAGGSLAVANHTASFSGQVTLATLLGGTNSYESLIRTALVKNVEPRFLEMTGAPTIVKRRFIESYPFQKLFELYVMDEEAALKKSNDVCELLSQIIKDYDLVVVADYGHGMLTAEVIDVLISGARCLAVNAQMNAGNHGFNTVSKYARADFISLSEKEIRLETRNPSGELRGIVEKVAARMSCACVLVTRGSQGCLCYSREEGFFQVPGFAIRTVDRVGAGDAVFSLASLCVALKVPTEVVGFVGNVVGTEAVGIVGNQRFIERAPLLKHIEALLK